MIDSLTAIGVNGSQVQINLDDNIFPLTHFEVTYDVTSDDQNKQQEHGSWPSPDYIGNAHLLLEGNLLAQSGADYWVKRFTFMAPFTPLPQQGFNETVQIIAQLTGWSDTLECNCNLDGGMPNAPLTNDIPAFSTWQLNLKLRDPRFYSSTIQSVALAAPTGQTGVTFPVTFPVVFSGANVTQGAAVNAGNAYADPTWQISGPCDNPQVYVVRSNGTTDRWELSGVHIPAGSTVVINFRDKTVIQDNVYSLYRYVSTTSKWWQLYNGSNVIGFTGLNTDTDTTATCSWQNAYFI